MSSNASNFNNNVNQRRFFQSRSNSFNKFNNINRFDKAQFVYQINVKNESFEQSTNQSKNEKNNYYDENDNWIDEKKLKEFWYNEYDVNFVTIVDIITIIHICQLYVVNFSSKNKLFTHFRNECWERFLNTNDVIANHVTTKIISTKSQKLIKSIVTFVNENDQVFREYYYTIVKLRFANNDDNEFINVCLNIDCSMTIDDK